MKRDIVWVGVVVLAVLLTWNFAKDFLRLEFAQKSSAARLAEYEARLLPLEQDLKRREVRWTKAKAAMGWIRGKLGF
jgi:hypothetical protein